ncbi:Sigma-adaptin 3A [Malassezia vespertilionis]|uniref:Aps3p n=1 Tax=Malassezia vespertilionis TaxID=2020962 RepID=A0A2N1JD75_9BASI|nr:Sigma-adaptin 3A [Malassezia vespertilionis]PKI84496.1 Aps3p [Malassezia vespertilionis]WFD06408.1 Sigma-adaptin 3A [Malassezia vespertilionis]
MTIRAVLIFNNYGKPRLTKFYSKLAADRQHALIQLIFQLVSRRNDRTVCNFLDAPELTPLLPPPVMNAWTKTSTSEEVSVSETSSLYPDDDDKGFDPWIQYERTQHEIPRDKKCRWRPDDELRVIYRHYATLYFVLVVDQSESELGILDLIQVIVEALDQCFENVCELDLIFHFDQVHVIIDHIIQGGLVLETNINETVAGAQTVLQAYKNASGASGGALSAFSAAQNATSLLAPQALLQQWNTMSFSTLAERGTDAFGVLQQLGSQYWSSEGLGSSRPQGRSFWI